MLTQISKLEHKIGDKVFHFLCDNDSPLEHVKESLFQFLKYVGSIEDAVKAQQAQHAAEAAKQHVESKVEQFSETTG